MHTIEFVTALIITIVHIKAFDIYRYEAIISVVHIIFNVTLKIVLLVAYNKKATEFFYPLLKYISICYFVIMVCFPIILMNFHMSCDYDFKIISEDIIPKKTDCFLLPFALHKYRCVITCNTSCILHYHYWNFLEKHYKFPEFIIVFALTFIFLEIILWGSTLANSSLNIKEKKSKKAALIYGKKVIRLDIATNI